MEDCAASWQKRVEGFSPRSNVYSIWRSRDPAARWLAIDTHLDTVMVTGMKPFGPFSAEITLDGKIHGRGACDTKAMFAIAITILTELQARGGELPVNLILAGTCGEETSRLGANHFREFLLARRIFVDELLVAEPTLCTPVVGHKGYVGLQFNIKGTAAHSSKPHLGNNALVAAAQLITRFYAEHEKTQASQRGPLGPPTITPTLGGGGHGLNIIPQDAYVYVEYRITTADTTNISEEPQDVADWMVTIAHEVLDESIHCTCFDVTNIAKDLEGCDGLRSFSQDSSSPWVHRLTQWSGLEPEVATFGTNASAYSQPAGTGILSTPQHTKPAAMNVKLAAPHPTSHAGAGTISTSSVYGSCVVMGPGDIEQAHMADEWVEIAQLNKMKVILEKWFQLS